MSFPPGTLVCGTGGGNFPQPGDPDLNSPIITCRAGNKTIAITWTFPNINGHAVAHTKLFRSNTPDEANKKLLANVGGNYHLDDDGLVVGERYYYWIQIVSVNGTVGDLIGPASCVVQSGVAETIAEMEGMLNESILNQSLREKIDLITDVSSSLSTEKQERLLGFAAFDELLEGVGDSLKEVDTLIHQESIDRVDGQSALVASVDLMLAKAGDNAAAILVEKAVSADATRAVALQYETMQATLDGDDGIVASLKESKELINDIQEGMSAEWTIKADLDGVVSGIGFRASNEDGQADSEFIVNATRFAVVNPGPDAEPAKKPFIIDKVNGVDQIALNARTLIPDAHITNAMVGNMIASDNYKITDEVKKGWAIFKNYYGYGGFAEFHNIYARGDIRASSIQAGVVRADIIAGGGVSKVYHGKNSTGKTLNPKQEVLCFTLKPAIPAGMTANLIGMVTFKGSAGGKGTNIGVIVKSVKGYVFSTVAEDDHSVRKNFTEGGALSFSLSNVPPGTHIKVYLRNTWHEGKITGGKTTGNMMMTLM